MAKKGKKGKMPPQMLAAMKKKKVSKAADNMFGK